jgi:hypothetical protein
MADIVLQSTFGNRKDVMVYDDDSVTVDSVPLPTAIVTKHEGTVRVALDSSKPTLLHINAVPPFAEIHVKRVPGWQGHLGWKATLISVDNQPPTNIALAVYNGPEASGGAYKYTTGAFKQDTDGTWYADCPPGFEPEHNDEHFSMLLGSKPYSPFTLWNNMDEIQVTIGGDV